MGGGMDSRSEEEKQMIQQNVYLEGDKALEVLWKSKILWLEICFS
jgi:hypothetical protein